MVKGEGGLEDPASCRTVRTWCLPLRFRLPGAGAASMSLEQSSAVAHRVLAILGTSRNRARESRG